MTRCAIIVAVMPDPQATCWTLIRAAADGAPRQREEFARRYAPVLRAYLAARWRGSPLRQDLDDAVNEPARPGRGVAARLHLQPTGTGLPVEFQKVGRSVRGGSILSQDGRQFREVVRLIDRAGLIDWDQHAQQFISQHVLIEPTRSAEAVQVAREGTKKLFPSHIDQKIT